MSFPKEIRPANRIADIREYYLQRKMKEVAALNAAGRDIISLGIGGPDMTPPAEAIEALCQSARRTDSHSYQLGTGIPALRQAFAAWYSRNYGVELDPEREILPLSGSKEGITFITLAFVNQGDAVLIPDPGYPTYTSVSRLAGAEIIKYPLTQAGGWQPDFDAMEAMPGIDRVKLMWLNYPHMPTGAPARTETFSRAVDFATRHGIVLVNDNPYSFILNDRPLSLLSVPGARDVAIELSSLSKAHNMAGWRMGMTAANPQFTQWILKVKSNIDSGQFRPVMEGAIAALGQGPEWYKALNEAYTERRRAAEEVMAALRCAFDPAQRGLFLWGEIPAGEADGEAFADRILSQARVFITPGFIFGDNGRRYIRISLCATADKLRQAARRITESRQ